MKHVRYRDGSYHVWCDIENRYLLQGGTRQDVIDFFIRIATERAQECAIMLCEESKSKVVH